MKKCPQCATEYFDNTLEFCLEDGSQAGLRSQGRVVRESWADAFRDVVGAGRASPDAGRSFGKTGSLAHARR